MPATPIAPPAKPELQPAAKSALTQQQRSAAPSGNIGVPLPGEKLIAALPAVKAALGKTSAHFDQFAHAILTTDTRRKVSARHFAADGKQVKIVGTCKGRRIILPQLVPHATMLAYIFTDAAIAPAD